MISYFLHDLWDKERTRDEDREAEIVVLTAAKLIMSEIREKEYDPSVYPKSDDITVPTDRWWLIDELSHLGFCSSYREVSRFKQSSMATEDASEVAVTLPPGSFAQYVADNVDHNLCTLDGKKTFHGMGIIQVSTNSSGTHNREKAIKRQKLELVNLVTKNRGIPIKQYIETNFSVMSTKIFKSMRDLQFEKNVSLEKNINLLWETSILFHKSARPSWSGFMQTYREGEYPGKSEVTVLPIIDLNPTDSSCIYSTLLFVMEQAQKANIGTATITFDQPLWLKAVKISSEKSLNILCRLGGFHTLMSFLGSVGTSMEGSGISECLQMVYGENAVVHILSDKAEQHVSEEDLAGINTLYDFFVNGKSSDEELTKSKVLEKVHGAIGNKMNHLSTTSRTAKLWIQYISYIDVIKQFIAAERTGNWKNHLETMAQMLNLFAATGHYHYAKSARLYLQMMAELPSTYPDLHEKFTSNGYHVVRRSDRFWSGLWPDLTIEQVLMRSLKTRGGVTRGRGMSENVMLTCIHSMHTCAKVHMAMTELTGNDHKTSQQHIELGASRIKRDNDDLEKIKTWLCEHDPFDENETLLKNIATGLTATESDRIYCDAAEKGGQEIHKKLDGFSFSEAKYRERIRFVHWKHSNWESR
ncbi:hypothetical protein GQR58_030367 [Nymphon striatum]|nr:hypothetical protein GQR58_030367 [Nymphon striatum]